MVLMGKDSGSETSQIYSTNLNLGNCASHSLNNQEPGEPPPSIDMSMQTRRHKRSSNRSVESPEMEGKGLKRARESDSGSGREEGELPPEPAREPAREPEPEAQLDDLLGKGVSLYKQFMEKRQRPVPYLTEEVIKEVNTSGEKQALEYFRKHAYKLKEDEKAAQTEEILKLQILKMFEETKRNQDAKRQKWINDAMSEAVNDFRHRLESAVCLTEEHPTDFYEEDYIRTSAQEANSLVMEEVKWNLPNERQEKIEYVKSTLKDQLDAILVQTLEKNKEHRSNCETALFNCIDSCQTDFKTRLNKIMSDDNEATTPEITEKAETIKKECITSYQNKPKPGTSDMHDKYLNKLTQNIGVDFEFLINTYRIMREQREKTFRDVIAKNSTEMGNFLMEHLNKQLGESYNSKYNELTDDFAKKTNPYPNRPEQREYWTNNNAAVLKKVYDDFAEQLKNLIPKEANVEETIEKGKKELTFNMHKVLRSCQKDYIERIESKITSMGAEVDMVELKQHQETTFSIIQQLLEQEAKNQKITETQFEEMKQQLTTFTDYYFQTLVYRFGPLVNGE